MIVSSLQKMTLVSCVVLCVALLLPKTLLTRGKRDASHADGPTGHFPPMPHRSPVSDEQRGSGRQSSRAHNPEAIARAKGASTAVSTGGKSNLAGQIIPIYGFGILLYILYILFKITSKGKTSKPSESRFTAVKLQNMKRKITDFELAQLQDRLNETKDVMESIISAASVCSHSVRDAAAGHDEQKLLHQLKEITRIMQEGQLVDQLPSNTEDESCGHQWNGFAEDNENEVNEVHFCCVHSPDTSSNAEMRDEQETSSDEMCADNTAEEPDGEQDDEKADANRNGPIEDMSRHQTQTENNTIRQRNRRSVK